MTRLRLSGRRPEGQPYGAPEWLRVIHEANGIEPGMFGTPESMGPWWAGGFVEEYPDARVILDSDEPDSGARIVSKTDKGARVLARAARNLGIWTTDEERGTGA